MNMPYASGAPHSPAALLIEGVRRDSHAGHALDIAHLRVRPGEAVAVAGLNGAGKTTLLRCILDLCAIDTGRIELFGVPHRNPAARARCAFLSEKFMPLYYLTGRDLLRYVLALHGRRYVEAEGRAMCDELDLDATVLERPARTLSKGTTQKLGLAACFLCRTPLLLLDEPASGLDAAGRRALATRLRKYRDDGGTAVFSSHHLADAAALADRIVVLHRGSLRYAGSPGAFLARYPAAGFEDAFLRCIDGATC